MARREGARKVRRGSLRQRASESSELRVNVGLDPATGRYRQRTKTFRGTEKQARHRIVPEFGVVPLRTVKASDLERWYAGCLATRISRAR